MQIHAIITREALSTGEPVFVAQGVELGIVSQGATEDEARVNLKEAIEGFFEVASPAEIKRRLAEGSTVTPLEVLEAAA